jgi:serine/threonine-protein kinase
MRVHLNDRFLVDGPIAPGGFGSVFRGVDSTTGETVAIKQFDPWVERDANFVAFFRQRARQATGLKHPNVVRTVGYGYADETYFLVWQYIGGGNLERLLDSAEGELPHRRVLAVLLDVCRGLSYMHARGVVHGRLAPSAILLSEGRGIVGDIGPGHQLTTTGMTMTSVATRSVTYLSPEQLSGQRATVASDIYSFGVMLYQACTGHVPFTSSNPVALAVEHLEKDAPAPRMVNPELSSGLNEIIVRCLSKAPRDRYSSIDEVGEALAAAMQPNAAALEDDSFPYMTPEMRRMIASRRGSWQMEVQPGHVVHYFTGRKLGPMRRLLRTLFGGRARAAR